MKDRLLELIDQTDHIRSLFHVVGGDGIPKVNVIYDSAEFSIWKKELLFELEMIPNGIQSEFLKETMTTLRDKFNGWNDEQAFMELVGSLHTIKKNIQLYYPDSVETVADTEVKQTMQDKKPKIFISHAGKDKKQVKLFVELLEAIGIGQGQLFCSSVPGYNIPIGEDIYEYLKRQFEDYDLHVFYMLSDNYYESAACLNEMGAAWILHSKYTTILLPTFDFQEIEGAVNPRRIGLKLDNDMSEVKDKLGQIKRGLEEEFGLDHIPDSRWEEKRDAFIESVLHPVVSGKPRVVVSEKAQRILAAASVDGEIMKWRTLSGLHIQAGKQDLTENQSAREIAKWEDALNELLRLGFVKPVGAKGEIFEITSSGYDYIDDSLS